MQHSINRYIVAKLGFLLRATLHILKLFGRLPIDDEILTFYKQLVQHLEYSLMVLSNADRLRQVKEEKFIDVFLDHVTIQERNS